MSSSDEAQDAEQLLSRFQSHRPSSRPVSSHYLSNEISSSHSISNGAVEQQLPQKRRGRPKKSHVSGAASFGSPSTQDGVARRRPGRPKKNLVKIELTDSEDSQFVRAASSKRRSCGRTSIDSPRGSSVEILQSPRPQAGYITHETPAIPLRDSRTPFIDILTGSAGSASQLNGGTAFRTRRSKAQVGNYYSNANYSGYISASEGEEGRRQEVQKIKRPTTASSHLRPSSQRPKGRASRVIYDNTGLRIYRHVFSKLEDIPHLPDKVPYTSQYEPSYYAKQFKLDIHTPILHVSFSDDEVSAMIVLLSSYGLNAQVAEMSSADQITHIVRSFHEDRLEQDFVDRILKMIQLQKLLVEQGFDSLDAFPQATDSMDAQKEQEINDLYNEIFAGKTTIIKPFQYIKMAAALRRRCRADLCAFISDARLGNIPTRPFYIIASQEHASTCRRQASILNICSRQSARNVGLRRSHTWKGASNDVLNLAWSPDGTKFAVGAAAQCDVHNMQYNRSNNLILGDCMQNCIRELSDHRVPFPMVNPPNPHLYMSVTAVQWFEDTLYTSSYDRTVKIWDVSTYTGAKCKHTLRHNHKVQVMARSHQNANVLATGTESTLHLWHLDADSQTCLDLDFMKQRSVKNPRSVRDADFTPSSLAWGLSSGTQDLFVAGFAGKGYHEGDACREGLLSTWKLAQSSIESIQLQPNAQNIFDVKFHPTIPWLATGSSVSAIGTNGTGKDIRSLVRIYEPLNKPRCAIEFDCPALDINDVSFCPMDRFYISASCTDGVTYVWDFRDPSKILHKLSHGDALNQLDEELTREQADVGVRVALWGRTIDEFITGGSDGVLKAWNILLAPEDVHVRDVAAIENEVMSGAFSPDKSTLLIGDAAGGVHLLQPGMSSEPVEELAYKHDNGESEFSLAAFDSGRAIGQKLLETRQLLLHPKYGVGKGPEYQGPYAAWARPNGTPVDEMAVTPLLEDIQALQLDHFGLRLHDTNMDTSEVTVDMQRKTAEIRNKVRSIRKRKDRDRHGVKKKHRLTHFIDLCSDGEESKKPRSQVWIDLTNESDIDKESETTAMDQEQDSDWDSEDYWFPDSRSIDPNIRHSD